MRNTVGSNCKIEHCLGMEGKLEGDKKLIAGINHMAWLLEIKDKYGNDLYPEIKARIPEKRADSEFADKVRFDCVNHFGYYCTESSEHNAEYNMFYIKSKYPELIERYSIPLDEYPRRCVRQVERWKKEYLELQQNGGKVHSLSKEYASPIMNAIVAGDPYKICGNVLNKGYLISNLPEEVCVEVPCLIDGYGVHPCYAGALPVQCAVMNMANINVQLLTVEVSRTGKKEHIYQAAMLDLHTGSELDIDTVKKMVDDLIRLTAAGCPSIIECRNIMKKPCGNKASVCRKSPAMLDFFCILWYNKEGEKDD